MTQPATTDAFFAAVRGRDATTVARLLRQRPELVRERDADGATPLHYATESGDREIVRLLLQAGADVNARDSRFDATPAGWAIEYLRRNGALLAMEIGDTLHAIERRDADLVRRYVSRLPALRDATDSESVPLRVHAQRSGDRAIIQAFEG